MKDLSRIVRVGSGDSNDGVWNGYGISYSPVVRVGSGPPNDGVWNGYGISYSRVVRVFGGADSDLTTCVRCDTFDRTATGDWGTGDFGAWSVNGWGSSPPSPLAPPVWSVDGSAAVVTTPRYIDEHWMECSDGPWGHAGAWKMTARVKASAWTQSASAGACLVFGLAESDWPRSTLPDAGWATLAIGHNSYEHQYLYVGGSTDFTIPDLTPDMWYDVEWEYRLGGPYRARVYPAGTVAPDWQAVWDGTTDADPDYPIPSLVSGTRLMVFPRLYDTTLTIQTICVCTSVWYDDFSPRSVSPGWGDPDDFPPGGDYINFFDPAQAPYLTDIGTGTTTYAVKAGTWGGAFNGSPTIGPANIWNDPAASVSGGQADYDNTVASYPDTTHDDPSMGIVFREPFSFPLEVLWTGVTVPQSPLDDGTSGHYDWNWQFYFVSTWGVNSVAFTPWYTGSMYLSFTDGTVNLYSAGLDGWLSGDVTGSGVIAISPGAKFDMRVRIDETGIHLKMWPSASSEPGSWDVSQGYAYGGSMAALAGVPFTPGDSWPLRGIAWDNQTIGWNGSHYVYAGHTTIERVDILEGYEG